MPVMGLGVHYIVMIVYLVLAVPSIALFIWRREHEPIRSRGWYLSVTSVTYGGVMICFLAVAAELDEQYGATPCNLVIWPFAPFTCFFLNPYFIRATILQFNHRWNKEKLRQSKDSKSERRLDWFQKNRWRVSHLSNWCWVWVNAAVYILVAVMYEFINVPDPLPNQSLPFDQCLAKTRILVVVLAIAGTLLLWGYYATFFDVADAFFFKKELAVIGIVLPVCYLLWALQVFDVALTFQGAHTAYFLYVAIYVALVVSIIVPLLLSARQTYMVRHLQALGVTSDSENEDDTSAAPIAILDDKVWTAGSIRLSDLTRPKRKGPGDADSNDGNAAGSSSLSSTAVLNGSGKNSSSHGSNTDGNSSENGSNGSGSGSRKRGKRTLRNGGTAIPPRMPTHKLFSICLINDILRTAFQRYCLESWCIENYLFYRDVVIYRTTADAALAGEAMRIADMYLPLESTLAVNLPADIRDRILDRIQKKEISHDLFEEAERAVLEFMRNDTFLKWRITDSFNQAWRQANISPEVLTTAARPSILSDENVNRLVNELGSSSQASGRPLAAATAEVGASQ